jgi:hypothetical protein
MSGKYSYSQIILYRVYGSVYVKGVCSLQFGCHCALIDNVFCTHCNLFCILFCIFCICVDI